jgi:hypothetical protein
VSYANILAALQAVVQTYATAHGLPVVWDNTEREAAHGEVVLLCSFLPARAVFATLGPTGADAKPGVYQVAVSTHRGRGPGLALQHADGLVAAFKRQRLTVAGTTVHSWRAWPAPGFDTGDRYVVPVSVEWTAIE